MRAQSASPPGDSSEQRAAEQVMLSLIAKTTGVAVQPRVFILDSGGRITVDGYSAAPLMLVEAWAHIGPPKPAQKSKVMTDTLKLVWLRSTMLHGARCLLAFADDQSAWPFRSGRTWMAACLRDLSVETIVVGLPAEVRAAVITAQDRQKR